MQKYPHLFSPIQIAGHIYKNRILCAPMLFGFYALEKESAERVYRFAEDRAKGGIAEVVIGEVPINFTDAADPFPSLRIEDGDLSKRTGRVFEAYKKYADIIKKYGAIANIEIFHAGQNRGMMGSKPKINPWGPVGFDREDGVTIEAFDAAKMKKVCDDFAIATEFMKAAGFDGVCIHGAHGYLFTQFLSPVTNRRTDEYGGSIENRGRFPRAILSSIRKTVGPDFIVELRIDGAEMVEGGQSVEDTAGFCSTLDGLVDIIHISSGLHMDSYRTHTFSSHYDPHGVNVEHAAYVKKKTGIPVAVVGGINCPDFAERIIAEGKVDFVSLGRQLIADPEFVKKTESGREDEIRRCLRCYHCYGTRPGPGSDEGRTEVMGPPSFEMPQRLSGLLDGVGHCTINPTANNELIIDKMQAPHSSGNVLVIGGGPGGMQAAITASDRGHKVTLVEKNSSLGGVIRFTDADTFKIDLKNFKDLLVRETERRNIKVLLKTEATPEFVTEFKPDTMILAIGASPALPPIPGINTAMHVLEVYKKDCMVGRKVVMLGGGLSGCETAIHLADNGHEVIIIEMLNRLASEIDGMPFDAVMDQIEKRQNLEVRIGAKCVEISLQGVKVEDASGGTIFIECDTVVYALGMDAKRAETERLRAAAGEATVLQIGDCVRGAKVFEAINEGFMAAMKVI